MAMATLLEDREAVRPLLMRDPIRNSVVIHRVFHEPRFTIAVVDALPDPKAVLALKPSEAADEPHQFALHALDPLAALHVLKAVPKGVCLYHVADELAFPAVQQVIGVRWWGDAILYRQGPEDFRDVQAHGIEPLDPRFAAKVAKIWAPDWPAEGYVESRIRRGLNAAICEDGEPVAWYLTHFETDEVVMLGFLHVMETHRRRGYAKTLSCALAKQAFAKGKVAACHVYTDNEPSIRLMEGLGFRRVVLQAWGDGVVRA